RSRSLFGKIFFIRKLVKKEKTGLIFTPLNKDISFLSLYKRLFNRRVRLVYQQQMLVGINKKDWVHRSRYAMLDRWISPLVYLKEEVLEKTGNPASKIAVIPLGADMGRLLKNNISREEARKMLNLPQQKKIIGILGRIDPMKGQDTLIRAVAIMKNDPVKNFDLLIMGSVTKDHGNEYLASLNKIAEESGIRDRIHFRPF